jgi:hypothetical protein
MAEEKALAAAQGSQSESGDKGERGKTCNSRTKTQSGKITIFKISIKGRDKAERERGRKEARNIFS